jgi:O-antigen/teichoic acid export membrane protein
MKGLLWVFFEKFGLTLLSVIATFWYAAILGPEGFGIATILLSVSLLISGIQDNIQQFPLLASRGNKTHVYLTSVKGWLLISVFVSVLLFFALINIFGFSFWFLILLSVLHIPISSVSKVFVADLIAKQAYKQLAMRAFWGKIIGVFSGLFLAYIGYVQLAIIFQSFVALLVALFIMSRSSELFSEVKLGLYEGFDWRLLISLIKEGIPSGVSMLESGAKSHGLIVLLGIFIGPNASGIYALAIKFIDIPRKLIGYGFSSWAMGKFHAVKDDYTVLLGVYKTAYLWSSMVLVPCYFGLIAVSDSLVSTFMGEEWKDVPSILSWLALFNCIMSLYILLPPLQVLSKTTYNTLPVSLASTATLLLFVIFGAQYFGLYAPIIGIFVSLLIIIPKFSSELSKILKIPFLSLLKLIAGFFIAGFLMLIAIELIKLKLQVDNLYLLVLSGVLVYSISVLCLTYFKAVNVDILKSIRSI